MRGGKKKVDERRKREREEEGRRQEAKTCNMHESERAVSIKGERERECCASHSSTARARERRMGDGQTRL